jgi:hypothetical protein
MDAGELIVAASAGALGGALGAGFWALAKRRGGPGMMRAALVATVVLIIAMGTAATRQTALLDAVNEQLGLESRLEAMTHAGGRRLLASAKYRALVHGKSSTETMLIGAQTSARGIAFLDEPSLDEWVRIRTQLAERSVLVCAGLWTGALDPDTIQRALSELPERDMQAWVDLTIDASLRAVEASGEAPADAHAAIAGLEKVIAALPEGERDAVRADLSQQGLPIERACKLMKIVHAGIPALPKDLRYRFVRALARG